MPHHGNKKFKERQAPPPPNKTETAGKLNPVKMVNINPKTAKAMYKAGMKANKEKIAKERYFNLRPAARSL